MWSPCGRGAPGVVAGRIQRVANSGWRDHRDLSAGATLAGRPAGAVAAAGGRDTVPVTMAAEDRGRRAGSHGGASLAQPPSVRRGSPGGTVGPRPRRPDRVDQGGPPQDRMLRIIHTADVHLGARHDDLGEQAAAQRERQFAAFKAAVDLALAEKVDLVPHRRRPVRLERPAAPLRRARGRRARSGSPARRSARSSSRAPTTSTTAPRSTAPTTCRPSPAARPNDDLVTVLDPDHADGPPPGARRPSSTAGSSRRSEPRRARCRASTSPPTRPTPRGRSGWSTARSRSRARPTATRSSSRPRRSPRADLDYLALGHWHSAQDGEGRDASTYAYAGAPGAGRPRPGPGRQGPAGRARREHGRQADRSRSRSARSGGRASSGSRSTPRRSSSQPALVDQPREARRSGPRPRRPARRRPPGRARPRHRRDRGALSRRRSSRSASATRRCRPLTEGRAAVAGHVAGAFIRDLEARIAELEAAGPQGRGRGAARRPPARSPAARRATRSRCEDPRAPAPRLPPLPRPRHRPRAGADHRPRPERGREVHDPAGDRAGPDAPGRRAPRPTSRPSGRGTPPRRSRPIVAIDFDAGRRTDGHEAGTLEKTFAGGEGHGPARLRRPVDHRPGARRPGARRADRHPDRGVLPLDRVGPPPRARATWRATRPRSATGCRRRSAAPTAGRAGRSKKLEQGAPRAEHQGRQEPGPAQGRRAGRGPGAGRGRAGRAALAQLERGPRHARRRPRRGAAEAETALVERRSAAREGPPGGAAHRRARRGPGALRPLPPGGRRRRRARRPRDDATRRPTRCRSCAPAVERLRTLDTRIRELRAALAGEVEVTFDVAPERAWQPLPRVVDPAHRRSA